jgi:hypothetical protein
VRSYLCTPSQQLSTQTAVTPLPQVIANTKVSQKITPTTQSKTSTSDITAQQAAAKLAQQQVDAAQLAQ